MSADSLQPAGVSSGGDAHAGPSGVSLPHAAEDVAALLAQELYVSGATMERLQELDASGATGTTVERLRLAQELEASSATMERLRARLTVVRGELAKPPEPELLCAAGLACVVAGGDARGHARVGGSSPSTPSSAPPQAAAAQPPPACAVCAQAHREVNAQWLTASVYGAPAALAADVAPSTVPLEALTSPPQAEPHEPLTKCGNDLEPAAAAPSTDKDNDPAARAPQPRRRRLFSPPGADPAAATTAARKGVAPPATPPAPPPRVSPAQPAQPAQPAPLATGLDGAVTAATGQKSAAQPMRAVHSVPTLHARKGAVPRGLGHPSPGNKFGLDKSISLQTVGRASARKDA